MPIHEHDWIDSETGHRIIQVSDVPYSSLPYFTTNASSLDKGLMAYSSPRGIHLLDLNVFTSKLLVEAGGRELWFIGMAHKSNRMFYLAKPNGASLASLESIDVNSGQVQVHAKIPASYRVETVNADDTFVAGVSEEPGQESSSARYVNKADALYGKFNQKKTMILFTINLATGDVSTVFKSTDWLSHPQFSPANPKLLMYSLEGPWHLLDRIWLINSDGTNRRLVHRRTMDMEIAGHEFWSTDGSSVLYDWQYPKGSVFYLAQYKVESGERSAFPVKRDEWSVHFNATNTPSVFVGDGADKRQVARSSADAYINLYLTSENKFDGHKEENWSMGTLHTERLADLRGHDYKLEPNARMTPDGKWVLFRSNMFGTPAIFAVEVRKSRGANERRTSTFELSKRLSKDYKEMMMSDNANDE